MALVLKTSVRKYRKFESCPFRQISETKACFGFSYLKGGLRLPILSLPPKIKEERSRPYFIGYLSHLA